MHHASVEEMITGTGQLRIGDLPLHISFTVPAGPCALGALLPGVQALADRIIDYCIAKAGQAGRPVSCQKGCGACCRQMVPVSPVEARETGALEWMPLIHSLDYVNENPAPPIHPHGATARGSVPQGNASMTTFSMLGTTLFHFFNAQEQQWPSLGNPNFHHAIRYGRKLA